MNVQFLWFDGCPNHEAARRMLVEVLAERDMQDFEDIDAGDPDVAVRLRFPGSPTIRIDDIDIEPGFIDPQDYTPRCRVYFTSQGLKGVPERAWILDLLRSREADQS
jgi:hypothetical protein